MGKTVLALESAKEGKHIYLFVSRKAATPLAREEAELFSVGFQQMVVKENGDWKSSFEHLDEARQLFAAARLSEAGLPAARATAEESALSRGSPANGLPRSFPASPDRR